MKQLQIITTTISGLLLILALIACTPTIEPGAANNNGSDSEDVEAVEEDVESAEENVDSS